MKKVIYFAVVAVLLAGLLLGCAPAPSPAPAPAPAPSPAPTPTPTPTPAEPIVLKIVSAFPTSASSVRYVGIMADIVKERSNGELIIDWVGGPEVMSPFEQPEAVRTGAIDFLASPAGYYQPILPIAYTFDLSHYNPMEERELGIFDMWAELHEQANVRYLGILNTGSSFHLYSNVWIETPYDMGGLKFRTSPAYVEILDALGVVSVMMRSSEAYSALERGVVDGTGQVHTTFNTNSMWEVTKYWIDHGFYRATISALVNMDKWNSLPKHLQDLLEEVVAELEPEALDFGATEEAELSQVFIDKGMVPIIFSPSDAKWYVDLAFSAKWEKAKEKLSPEEYARVWEALMR